MHDLDRTQLEMEWETDPYDVDEFEDEYAYDEFEYETYPDESEYYGEYEMEFEYGFESPLDDAEEMELASDLLEVMDDEELDLFLGKVFKWAKKKYKKVVPRTVRRHISKRLKGVARRVLPMAGTAVGSVFGGPAGGAIGGRLASMAGRSFGLELEGLSPEDQEFEVARRFARLAAEAARQASKAPPTAPAQAVAKKALATAIKKHAPGVGGGIKARPGRRHRGVWKRRGNTIVIFGA